MLTDLTGSKDGTVRLWEWGHMECINEPRKPGAFPKVTKVLFNAQGNKVQHSTCLIFTCNSTLIIHKSYTLHLLNVQVGSINKKV